MISTVNFEGKSVFAAGNLGFDKFESQHQCNLYCKHYSLRPFKKVHPLAQQHKISEQFKEMEAQFENSIDVDSMMANIINVRVNSYRSLLPIARF